MQNQLFNNLIMYIWDTGVLLSRQSVNKDDSVMFSWAASVKIQETKHALETSHHFGLRMLPPFQEVYLLVV